MPIRSNFFLKYFSLVFFIIYFFIGLLIFQDYGITTDEEFQRFSGFYWLKYVLSFTTFNELKLLVDAKFNSISGFTLPNPKNYPVYGVIFDLPAAFIETLFKIEDSKKSGADIVGSDDLIEKINNGYLSFDKLVATPSMMGKIGKLGKVLGPKGLMPNPKLGTVTNDIKKTVNEIKSGQVEIKNDKDGNVSFSFGKAKQSNEQLEKNFNAVFEIILKEKPNNIKGNFILSSYVTSTMGPSYKFKAKGAN